MGRTWIRQDVQIGSTLYTDGGYVDNVAPSATNYETNAATLTDDLNNARSAIQNILNRDGASMPSGNWYDDISTPTTFENGKERGVSTVNQDLHDLQRKRVLVQIAELAVITVPAGAYASGVLSGTINYADGDTVTIGSTVYTMKSPFVDAAFNVDASVSLAATMQNLHDAINLTGTPGSQYGTATTIHPTVTCTSSNATSASIRAKVTGTAGNLIVTTSSVADPAFGAAKLTSGAGDVNVLTLAPDQLPTWTLGKIAAIGSVTTRGTVCAYNANFGVNDPAVVVSGSNAISPKNLCVLEDSVNHDPILSSGRVVYALFQSESNTDGSTLTGTTPDRAMLSYVRINSGGTALEVCPTADIAGKTLHYASVGRKALEDLNEQDFLKGAVIDVAGPSYVDRQIAYDNQGIVPVDLITNALLDLSSAGLYWTIRDLAEAALFTITEGSTGGTSTVTLGADVDTFDSSAIVNDFDKGVKARTGGVEIDIGVTTIASTGTIETTGSNDLRVFGARELFLDDGNQAGSTWAQTNGIKLSDTTAEWDAYEAAFGGEVSLLKGITDAYTKQKRTKVQAVLTSDVVATNNVNGPSYAANCDVDLLPFNNVPTSFLQDVEVYLNGELLRNAAAGTEDVYPGTTPSQGDLKFTFKLKGTGAKPDQLTVIVNGQ
jgi:hypothetical protein